MTGDHLINDRQNDQLMDTLDGNSGTAFEWSDLSVNKAELDARYKYYGVA